MTVEDAEFYQFSYSLNGENWTPVGKRIPGSHVEGARIALTHAGKGRGARFDWLRIIQINRAKSAAGGGN
jgi:hypothetical protein